MELTPRQQEFVRRVHEDEVDDLHWSLGWPLSEHRRTFVARFECANGHRWVESTDGYELPPDDEFDNVCPECDLIGKATIEDEADTDEFKDRSDDLGFSWQGCDCCGSPLGGTRYAATLIRTAGSAFGEAAIAVAVCDSCRSYIANDDVPDDEYLTWLDDEDLDNQLTHDED